MEALSTHAADAGAEGIITDASAAAVSFYQATGFRLPGAVFLIRDVGD